MILSAKGLEGDVRVEGLNDRYRYTITFLLERNEVGEEAKVGG